MTPHTPVMLEEVLHYLRPEPHKIYIDGTFGRGGYTQALLDKGCRVIALDRDHEAIACQKPTPNLTLIQACFGTVEKVIHTQGINQVDGFVLDLGVSSPQIDTAQRGFSFRLNGPLDMRMDINESLTAKDVVNTYNETRLANIIYELGEERFSRRVARAIITARAISPITTTDHLASIVRSVVKKSQDGLDPATRTFQALRLYVNDELGELERALKASLSILKPGGFMVVVTFHSLEDRYVKRFFRQHSSKAPRPSRHSMPLSENIPSFKSLTPKAIRPTMDECRKNPRASSAKLRAVESISFSKASPCQD